MNFPLPSYSFHIQAKLKKVKIPEPFQVKRKGKNYFLLLAINS